MVSLTLENNDGEGGSFADQQPVVNDRHSYLKNGS